MKNKEENKDKQLSDLITKVWDKEPTLRLDSPEVDQEFNEIWDLVEKKQLKQNRTFPMWKYAAALILICSTVLAWYRYQSDPVEQDKVIDIISRNTLPGEKLKIILSDSTVVYLSGSSKLTWPSHFKKDAQRSVYLEGEGFFEVKRDTSRPFIVHSGTIETRVLGTSFNISAYPVDHIFSVAVRTGKVQVSENSKDGLKRLSLLSPGMKLEYDNQNRRYLVNATKTEDVSSWTTNRFVFRDASLGSILSQLERYYNVRFNLKSPCLATGRQFNATFSQKSIKEVLDQLRLMSAEKIHYKITADKIITLWGEGCE